MKTELKQNLCDDNTAKSSLKPLLVKMILIMAVINVLFYSLSLVWGFELSMLLGFAIGYIYVALCYIYVAKTVENAVEMSEKKAKRTVITCYAVRYAGLFLLCFVAAEFKFFSIIGIVIPQFYPKMALGIIAFWESKSMGKDKV
ncbi:MAG: ATP synthase subunit I [Oscillospiraceae bacterium]